MNVQNHPKTVSEETAAERVAAAVLAYYCLVEAPPISAHELATWFAHLLLPVQEGLKRSGPREWLRLPALKRYVLEKHGHAMRAHLAGRLTPDELADWIDDDDGGVRA